MFYKNSVPAIKINGILKQAVSPVSHKVTVVMLSVEVYYICITKVVT